MTTPTTPLNILITQAQRAALTELATYNSNSLSAMIRQLIVTAHAHVFEATPLCADGTPCYVPGRHLMTRAQAAAAAPAPGNPAPAPAPTIPAAETPNQEPNP